MGQITDVHPLALNNILRVIEKGIDLGRHRRDLGRIGLGQALLLPALHIDDLAGQVKQRPQANTDLHEDRDQRPQRQHQKRTRRDQGEAAHILVHWRAILGGEEDKGTGINH